MLLAENTNLYKFCNNKKNMAQFICSSCNYKFSSFRKPMKCPYCGKSKTVNEEASAEDLIKEADDMISEGRL